MQAAAGLLRLGTIVDYISSPVVLGYISGAGVLIGVGQLHNVTGTTGPGGVLATSRLSFEQVAANSLGRGVAVIFPATAARNRTPASWQSPKMMVAS